MHETIAYALCHFLAGLGRMRHENMRSPVPRRASGGLDVTAHYGRRGPWSVFVPRVRWHEDRQDEVPYGGFSTIAKADHMQKTHMTDRSARAQVLFFFLGLAGLLFFLGHYGQPLAHPYFDQIGIRDAGTLFSTYAASPEPFKNLVGRTMLHIEGPLQFLLINAYAYAIGNVLPLNPGIVQIPNTILALLAAFVAYLLGCRLGSQRLGYCCALTFALGPWLGETLRQPWYFNTLSCFLHFSILYCFLKLCDDGDSRRFRFLAPACLAAYLFTGMDWPSFLFTLGLFLVTSGYFKRILRNPCNLLVLGAVIVQVAWPVALYLTGRERVLPGTILLYPFLRYGDLAGNPDVWSRIWVNVIVPWGPQLLFAIAGLVAYAIYWRREVSSRSQDRALLDSVCVWFLGAAYALFRSSTSGTYLYVAAAPAALLGGIALCRWKPRWIACAAVLMAVCQVWLTVGQHFTDEDEGRRVLAAATFLIEQRPDLLAKDKTALLPRNKASNVGQYARGKNRRIIMPQEFPVELRKHAIGSDEKTLKQFVDEFNSQGRIHADWLVLDSELFSPDLQAAGFYTRLKDDPAVAWIARFRDASGELFVGEVREKGRGLPAAKAPLLDTRSLSDKYEAKYDRIDFLKQNVQYVDHY